MKRAHLNLISVGQSGVLATVPPSRPSHECGSMHRGVQSAFPAEV